MRKLSFEQLSLLPKVHEDSEFIENNKIQIATYNDVLEDERRRIVVQALFTRMLGIGIIAADGFIISQNGFIEAIPERMLYEFI